jgi:hypothetical protein
VIEKENPDKKITIVYLSSSPNESYCIVKYRAMQNTTKTDNAVIQNIIG